MTTYYMRYRVGKGRQKNGQKLLRTKMVKTVRQKIAIKVTLKNSKHSDAAKLAITETLKNGKH